MSFDINTYVLTAKKTATVHILRTAILKQASTIICK